MKKFLLTVCLLLAPSLAQAQAFASIGPTGPGTAGALTVSTIAVSSITSSAALNLSATGNIALSAGVGNSVFAGTNNVFSTAMTNNGIAPNGDNTYTNGASGARWTNLWLVSVTGTNADFLCLSSTGQVLIQASACTISSARFKENIEPWRGDAITELKKLEPVAFNMKQSDEPNRDPNYTSRQIGLTAENVAAVDARLAIYEDDGVTPKSYRQEAVIALLVKANQELAACQASWRCRIFGR